MTKFRTWRFFKWLLLGVILLFGLVILLTQLPAVQRIAAKKGVNWLSDKLETKASFEHIRWTNFQQLELTNVYLEDRQSDTLLAVALLTLHFSPRGLFQNRLTICDLELSDGVVNLNMGSDSIWNYQFILDAFASEAPTDTSGLPWELDPRSIALHNMRFNYIEHSSQLHVRLPELAIAFDFVDLIHKTIHVEKLDLQNPFITYAQENVSVQNSTDNISPISMQFPDFGWNIKLNRSELKGGHIAYQVPNKEVITPNTFNPSNIKLSSIDWNIENLVVDSDRIIATIGGLQFRDQSGLGVEDFQMKGEFTDSEFSVDDFILRTNQSAIRLTAKTKYPSLAALLKFILGKAQDDPSLYTIQVDDLDMELSANEIRQLFPGLLPSTWNEKINIIAVAQGDMKSVQLKNLDIKQGNKLVLKMDGVIHQPLDINNTNVVLQISDLKASYAALNKILPANTLPIGLKPWNNIKASGFVSGNMKAVRTKNIRIQTSSGPQFHGDIRIKGLDHIESATIDLNIKELSTTANDWRGFISDTLPALADSLGTMVIDGTFAGTITQFKTDLKMNSDLGALIVDANFDFNDDYSNGKYEGQIALEEFEAGIILGDTALGQINMVGNLSGVGLQPKDWNTDVQLAIKNIVYNKYSYNSLIVNGRLYSATFDGDMAMNDPHLKFNFKGKIPFSDSIMNMDIALQLDTIDLLPLGLSRVPYSLSMKMEGTITDVSVDNLNTKMVISNFNISDSIRTVHLDSMKLISTLDESGKRNLMFDSDFMELGLSGEYQLSQLATEIEDWIAQDFPIQQILRPIQTAEVAPVVPPESNEFPTPRTNIIGFVRISDPIAITSLFAPELKQLDSVDIRLEFDKSKKLWELDANIPYVRYADWSIDAFTFNSNYRDLYIKSKINAEQIRFGDNTTISNPSVDITLKEDQLIFDAISASTNDSIGWKLGGQFTTDGQEINLSFAPDIHIQGEEYTIKSNEVSYDNISDWTVDNLSLSKSQSEIIVDGKGNADLSESKININFKTFDIGILSPILDLPSGFMQGELNGSVQAHDLQTNLNYTADLTLNDWIVDSVELGKLSMQASQGPNDALINITGDLTSDVNDVILSGTYNTSNQYFDINGNIRRLAMESLDPFLIGMIHDSKGDLSGQFSLIGNPDQPKIDGKLFLDNVQTTVDYVNIPYRVENSTIEFNQKSIVLGDIKLAHGEDQHAVLSGRVTHEYFNNFMLDIQFKTDKFQFLNTTAQDNELFYGTVLLKTNMAITGPIEKINYRIDATTLPGTELFVVPLTDEQIITQEDYIIFGKPQYDSLGRDTNYLHETSLTTPDIDLQLNLEMTPAAVFQIIIDPLTGDKLVCSGSSNLSVVMTPDGELKVIGNYEIKAGKYYFSYEQLVKKEFDILENSKISFDGDPLKARLDITAAYQTRVPLSDLVTNQVGSVQNTLTSLRADVRVLMKIGGNLENPILTFDIVLLGNPQGAVADAARTRLQQLRTNDTDLNTQVFGLLLFNSFLVDNGGQSIGGAGEAIVLSSLSKLVSNQLNKLAGGVLKGVELNLGVEAYKAGVESGNTVNTEVQLGLSKKLLDDRLTVKVGGNLNVGATSEDQETLTALTGDFALEYQLKENGNSILRVYQRSDYDALYEGNVSKTGVGISIRKDLKNKELKNKERKQKQ